MKTDSAHIFKQVLQTTATGSLGIMPSPQETPMAQILLVKTSHAQT